MLRAAPLLCERGVGHSIGLLGPVDTAAEDDLTSGCGSWNPSAELRMDIVNADAEGCGDTGGCDGSGLRFWVEAEAAGATGAALALAPAPAPARVEEVGAAAASVGGAGAGPGTGIGADSVSAMFSRSSRRASSSEESLN